MDIFKSFATDPNTELNGTWFDLGGAERTLADGSPDPASVPRILVARNGNRKHSRLVVALYEANRSTLERKDEAAQAKNDEITVTVMSQAILLGWKNLSFNGAPLPDTYDSKTAVMLLEVKDFRELVAKHSLDMSSYLLSKEGEDVKN